MTTRVLFDLPRPRVRGSAANASGSGGGPKTVEKPSKTVTKTDTKTDTETRTQRPWNVIVHDDPISLMSYVTRVFIDVFRYSQTKAHKLMMEVHTAGRSVVWTGAREKAETYVTRLHGFHLLATLEQVGD